MVDGGHTNSLEMLLSLHNFYPVNTRLEINELWWERCEAAARSIMTIIPMLNVSISLDQNNN